MVNRTVMISDTGHPRFGDRGLVVSASGNLVDVQMHHRDPNKAIVIRFKKDQVRVVEPGNGIKFHVWNVPITASGRTPKEAWHKAARMMLRSDPPADYKTL